MKKNKMFNRLFRVVYFEVRYGTVQRTPCPGNLLKIWASYSLGHRLNTILNVEFDENRSKPLALRVY